jgi:hypothetical protein
MYPSAWRERYGDEYADLLEQHRLDGRTLVDVIMGGLDARLGVGSRDSRRRSALAVALWALAAYAVAAIGFAKVIEYDDFTTAARHHLSVGIGLDLVRVGAVIAGLAGALAGLVILAAAVKDRHRRDVARPLVRGALAGLVVVCLPAVLVAAARFDPAGGPQRPENLAIIALWLTMSAVAGAIALSDAGKVTRRVELPPERLHQAVACAWVCAGGIAITLGGMLLWGIGLRQTDRAAFNLHQGGLVSTPTAPSWITETGLVAAALGLTLLALLRTLRQDTAPTSR